MSSIRRILASRANGALSQGPSTPQGKQLSARNALRHGLLARRVVLETESQDTFEAFLGQHLDRLQPADGVEFAMIEEMAAALWRMRRAWAIETGLLDNALSAYPDPSSGNEVKRVTRAFAALGTSPSLALVHRYETRLQHTYQRALHNLLLLRTAFPPNEPSPINGTHPLPCSSPALLPEAKL